MKKILLLTIMLASSFSAQAATIYSVDYSLTYSGGFIGTETGSSTSTLTGNIMTFDMDVLVDIVANSQGAVNRSLQANYSFEYDLVNLTGDAYINNCTPLSGVGNLCDIYLPVGGPYPVPPFTVSATSGPLIELSISHNDGLFTFSEVPIPAAAWLFGSALFGLGVVKRKRA